MTQPTISATRLRELLNYDPETGIFTWRLAGRGYKCPVGGIAGTPCQGYTHIKLDAKLNYAHRLAWLYVHDALPNGCIDHIDGNRSNNRLANLRIATKGENAQNQRKAKKTSKTGFLGVCFGPRRLNGTASFTAQICINGKFSYLGMYETAEAAHAAYLKAKRELHPMCTI